MEEAGRLKKREGSVEVAPMKEMLEEFDREVDERGPCKRHKNV